MRPPGDLRVDDWSRLALGLGGAAVAGAVVIYLSRLVSRHIGWGRELYRELHEILGGLAPGQIWTLALLSAFGEEILFRGVIHPRMGLWATAAIFGLFHFPIRRRLVPWTLFAGVLGVVLGGLTDASGSLWPAILLHFTVNHFNMHDLADHPLPEQEPPAEPS